MCWRALEQMLPKSLLTIFPHMPNISYSKFVISPLASLSTDASMHADWGSSVVEGIPFNPQEKKLHTNIRPSLLLTTEACSAVSPRNGHVVPTVLVPLDSQEENYLRVLWAGQFPHWPDVWWLIPQVNNPSLLWSPTPFLGPLPNELPIMKDVLLESPTPTKSNTDPHTWVHGMVLSGLGVLLSDGLHA